MNTTRLEIARSARLEQQEAVSQLLDSISPGRLRRGTANIPASVVSVPDECLTVIEISKDKLRECGLATGEVQVVVK